VKPIGTWASAGHTTAVTQPDTLRAVIRYLNSPGHYRRSPGHN
jgi:hypothetical protein